MEIPTKTYRVIIHYLRESIESGRYKRGEKLPSEKELCAQFETSRSSVREALSALEYVGLIEVRGGSGYYVTGNVIATAEDNVARCKTKVICTIDDSWSAKTIKMLFEGGVDGGNLLLRYDNIDEWSKRVRLVRQAANDAGIPLAILVQLCTEDLEKIEELVEFVIRFKVDVIIVDIACEAQGVLAVRRILDSMEVNVLILARITEAGRNIENVLHIADGLVIDHTLLTRDNNTQVVADMVTKCNAGGKIVVVEVPVRETLTHGNHGGHDLISKAILVGCDSIMITATGSAQKFPLDIIPMFKGVARSAEERVALRNGIKLDHIVNSPLVNALCSAAVHAADAMKAVAFIVPSETGFTPRLLAKFRQASPIIAVSPQAHVVHQLGLVWGVEPLLSRKTLRQEDTIQLAVETALKANRLTDGDGVVGVVGSMDVPNAYNAVKLIIVGDVILKGQGIGDGIVSGRVSIIQTRFDSHKSAKNKILVIKATEAEHVKLIKEANGLIVEEAGLSSHAAITCLSLGKPLIVGARDAVEILLEDEQVTIDVMRGLVYRGQLNMGG